MIDLIAVHNLRDTDTQLATLREMKKAGRIRYVGITTSFPRQYKEFEQVMRKETLDFIQVDYALDNRETGERILPLAGDRGIAVMINLPFGRGRKYISDASPVVDAFLGGWQLAGINRVMPGEMVTLMGRNGMGKTTTVRSIMGLTPAASGSIRFAGEEIRAFPSYRIAKLGLGLVPEGRQIFPNLSARENLIATAANTGRGANAWTLDKIGPLALTADDCGLVLIIDEDRRTCGTGAAIAEGIAPERIFEAISNRTNEVVLCDPGRKKEWASPGKPEGSVHGDSAGVHASDAAHAWRTIALASNAKQRNAAIVLAAWRCARDDVSKWSPRPSVEIPSARTRNAHMSAASSIRFVVGFPAPCPARVSMRMRTGLSQPCAHCSSAANLKLCAGNTRSS